MYCFISVSWNRVQRSLIIILNQRNVNHIIHIHKSLTTCGLCKVCDEKTSWWDGQGEGGTCSGSEEPCSQDQGFFQYSGFFFLQGSHFITKFQTISHGIGYWHFKDQKPREGMSPEHLTCLDDSNGDDDIASLSDQAGYTLMAALHSSKILSNTNPYETNSHP